MKRWTIAEDNILKKLYKTTKAKDIAKKLGRTRSSIKNRINTLGLSLCEVERVKRVRSGRFYKGMTAWNKGIKGLHFSPATEFKKGHIPQNTKSDGVISLRKDKCNKTYKFIRISQAKWIPLQHHIWIQHYGKLPKGKIIVFKNYDPMDVRIENLMAITRAENAKRNANYYTDKSIANYLAWHNEDLKQEFLKHPELIELKRQQLKLQRAIYAAEK